jgi:transposase
VVANPRQVKLITESSRKDDRLDAQTLARIDPQLLRPIRHRSEKAQAALMVIRVRAALIAVRTSLVNTARGLAKAMGERLPTCDADQMGVQRAESLTPRLRQALEPLLKEVESITEKIKDSDREVEQIARKDYPETALLQQVGGVGPLIALPSYSLSRIRVDSRRVGISAVTWGYGRGAAIRARASRSCESARRAIPICGRCWCKARTTSSAGEDLIPI